MGTSVECNVGDETWMRGTVVALDYVEEGWDQPAPYQVELEDGTLIFAPIDEDRVIRRQLAANFVCVTAHQNCSAGQGAVERRPPGA